MSRVIPRGAVVAGLGKRFLAFVIDVLPLLMIGGLGTVAMNAASGPTVMLVISIAMVVVSLGYALYQWWAYATRGAGLGAQIMSLRLVSLQDGEPIGWWRVFLRYLIFGALMGTVVGGIALVVFLVIHERRQGWHDMATNAVVIQPREAEVRRPRPGQNTVAQASTVGLPPHLSSSFSPQAGTSTGNWGSFAPSGQPPVQAAPPAPTPQPSAPDWLPGVQDEPIAPAQPAPPVRPAQPVPLPPAPPAQPVQQAPFNADVHWQPPTPQPPSAQSHMPSGQPPTSAPTPSPVLPGQPSSADTPSRPVPQWIPLPTPSSVIEPSVKVRPRDFGEVEEDEGTRIAHVPTQAGRAGDEGWYVRLDDGREVELNVTVLLGRNPQKLPDDPEVHLVPASGDGRMISRTHLLIGTDLRGVYVMDRGSTNGTALVVQSGQLEPCPAGTQMRVREGQQVSYGNRWFTVLRRPVL